MFGVRLPVVGLWVPPRARRVFTSFACRERSRRLMGVPLFLRAHSHVQLSC